MGRQPGCLMKGFDKVAARQAARFGDIGNRERWQVKLRPLPAPDFIDGLLQRSAGEVKMDAVERSLQVGNPSAIEVMDRDGSCLIGDETSDTPVEPQFLFAERAQLQHDEIGVFEFVWRGAADISSRCLESTDADL